jgi:hypothetical protein
MYRKPPVTRTGKSGWLRRRSTRVKSLVVVGAIALGFAGTALVAALPASADPAFNFIAIGSDTTENVMDYFAADTGGGILASYDAVNPTSQAQAELITPAVALAGGAQLNCDFTRPNGSGQGLETIDHSDGGPLADGLATEVQAGCIAVSRSSSAPSAATGAAGTLLATGNLVYIPFAVDAVTWATGPTTSISETTQCVAATSGCSGVGQNGNAPGIGNITFMTTPTTISQTADFSVAQLTTLYGTCSSVTVGSTTYNPVGVSFAFTTPASSAVFTATGSTFANGQQVTLGSSSNTTNTLPGGFSAGVSYFVVNASGASFSLALTSGGTAITSSSAGSGLVDTPGNIDLYAPQNGSGTLKFWESTLGTNGTVEPCWHQTIVAGPAAGISVEEHDGSALASDPNGIAPNSIAKWIGMNGGQITPDVRHGSILQSVTVTTTTPATIVPPTTGGATPVMNIAGCTNSASTFNQATCFPITREVYNVMDYYEVVNTPPLTGQIGNPAFNSLLSGLFAGPTSALCEQGFLIEQLGFGDLPTTASAFKDTCGATTASLRVQMNTSTTQG